MGRGVQVHVSQVSEGICSSSGGDRPKSSKYVATAPLQNARMSMSLILGDDLISVGVDMPR